jgi:hypothetical protein
MALYPGRQKYSELVNFFYEIRFEVFTAGANEDYFDGM